MFPADPVAAAPAILSTLERVFPRRRGLDRHRPDDRDRLGPAGELPHRAGRRDLLSLPDPAIVIIGRVRIALPAPQLPIVDLRATVYGEITPDHLLILVSLNGSRIATFTVFGDIGLLVRWGGSPEFAISAGGFHPRYDAAARAHRHAPARDGSLAAGDPDAALGVATSRSRATACSSARASRWAPTSASAEISGHFGFDALIIFAPRFAFVIEVGIGLTVRVFGVTLLGVHIELHLSGPAPWRAQGSAEVEILFVTISIDVGPFTWGDARQPAAGARRSAAARARRDSSQSRRVAGADAARCRSRRPSQAPRRRARSK